MRKVRRSLRTDEMKAIVTDSTLANVTSATSSSSISNKSSKKTNSTLLRAASPYIQRITVPGDKSIARLECPPLNEDRYQYLRPEANSSNENGSESGLKYFFALDLCQCREVLPRLLGSIIESIRFLGPRYCALSIVEGRSNDGTYEVLTLLQQHVERMGAKFFLQTNEINPKAPGANRIEALSELRNQALQPLIDLHLQGDPDTTVIFINDVAICTEDSLELIHQRRHQAADLTCAMDWTYVGPDPTFYDVWIARGMNGDSFFEIPADGNWNSAWNLFWNNPEAKQSVSAGKPFQVFSCWNGAVTFTAKAIIEGKIQFRSAMKDECSQGEPKSFCKDMWSLGYGKIAVVPSVNLEYSDENAKRIKSAKGFVSDLASNNNIDETIAWKSTPPENVKCIAGYDNQHWRPWDEKVLDRNTTS
ncbi:MAG: hypothetical protein Q9222_001319 [Ikaeria aurantiellina]